MRKTQAFFSIVFPQMVVPVCARLNAAPRTTARSGVPEHDFNARRRSHGRFHSVRAVTMRRTRTRTKADTNADQPPFPTATRKRTTLITNPAVYKTLSVIRKRAGDYVDSPQIVGVPSSAFKMAERHFLAELKALIREAFVLNKKEIARDEKERTGVTKYSMSETFDSSSDDFEEESVEEERQEEIERQGELLLEYLERMKLSNAKIWEREKRLPKVESPWIIEGPYYLLCKVLDVWFPENKPVQRFWFLETVARMPYFSYTTMLTLYELLGWWRRSSELRKVHFAEEWNEYHHLLIMESLGGNTFFLFPFRCCLFVL